MTVLPDIISAQGVRATIQRALDEDIGVGDATSLALVPADAVVTAVLLAREPCVVSGAPVAECAFSAVDPRLECQTVMPDGARASAGGTIMRVTGPAQSLLTAERTALNFMQRMTGIATLTAQFVAKVEQHGVWILDTRKTTPGLRPLEKYAVLCGGGHNHRIGLYDRVLIKDNHRRLWRPAGAGSADSHGGAERLDLAVEAARRRFPELEVEVEVETEEELRSALKARPEWILLDNMSPADMSRCAQLCKGISKVEASGGITLATIEDVAATGIDAVSLGCLTHSAPSVDLSLEIE